MPQNENLLQKLTLIENKLMAVEGNHERKVAELLSLKEMVSASNSREISDQSSSQSDSASEAIGTNLIIVEGPERYHKCPSLSSSMISNSESMSTDETSTVSSGIQTTDFQFINRSKIMQMVKCQRDLAQRQVNRLNVHNTNYRNSLNDAYNAMEELMKIKYELGQDNERLKAENARLIQEAEDQKQTVLKSNMMFAERSEMLIQQKKKIKGDTIKMQGRHQRQRKMWKDKNSFLKDALESLKDREEALQNEMKQIRIDHKLKLDEAKEANEKLLVIAHNKERTLLVEYRKMKEMLNSRSSSMTRTEHHEIELEGKLDRIEAGLKQKMQETKFMKQRVMALTQSCVIESA